jgi:2-oxoglutarate ferredoxin oxidoreductase subunit gamma
MFIARSTRHKKLKRIEIRISGLGGQGVVLAGQILGKAAVYDGKNTVQTQSYGAEARGSAAKSEVIISEGKTGFPAVRKCDILVAMSQQALNRNISDLREGGFLIVDSTYVTEIPERNVRIFRIPATENSEKEFGAKTYANMFVLGALTKITNIVTSNAIRRAIEDTVPQKYVSVNKQAYEKGIESVQ